MSESHIDPHMMRLPGEQIAAEHYLRTRIAELSQRVTQANETIVLQARIIVTRSDAIKRVRELHKPGKMGWCISCGPDIKNPLGEPTPCLTITALDGEQE